MSRKTIRERVRWRLVRMINLLPGQCWADLVTWALDGPRQQGWVPLQPIGEACRADAARTGTCYCGRLLGPWRPPRECIWCGRPASCTAGYCSTKCSNQAADEPWE